MHKHRAKKFDLRPFSGPVRTPSQPRAHGNACEVATCACGAKRFTNFNGKAHERGPWVLPEESNDE